MSYYGGITLDNRWKHLMSIKAEQNKAKQEAEKAKADKEQAKPEQKPKTEKAAFAKVCRIANKIPRSVSRKEAFTTAWRIIKNGGYEVKVSGVSFQNRQEALRRLTTHDPQHIHAVLVPEFDNPYDSNAIAVQVMVDGGKGAYRIGYVPKTETAIVKTFLGTIPALEVFDGDICGAKVRLSA